MTHISVTGPGGTREPGNKTDRTRFRSLTQKEQEGVAKRAWLLYDGTRTIARCWKEALNGGYVQQVSGTGEVFLSRELYPGGKA
jgi:hypothetical protein